MATMENYTIHFNIILSQTLPNNWRGRNACIFHYLKVFIMPVCFLGKTYLSLCFCQPDEIQRGLLLLQTKVKSENSVQHLFYSETLLCISLSEKGRANLLPKELHAVCQYQAAIVLNGFCGHLWFILNCFNIKQLSVSKMCCKVSEKPKRTWKGIILSIKWI